MWPRTRPRLKSPPFTRPLGARHAMQQIRDFIDSVGLVVLLSLFGGVALAAKNRERSLWGLLCCCVVAVFNPIFLIVLGVLALIAAVVALIYYWSDVKAYLADTTWGGPLLAIMEELEAGWNMLTNLFTDFTWTKLLRMVIIAALKPLEYFIKALGKLADALGFDVGKKMMAFSAADMADELLGGGNGTAAAQASGKVLPKAAYAPAVLGGMPVAAEPYRPEVGSLRQLRMPNTDDTRALAAQVSNRTNNTGRTMTIGEQHLHFENPPQNMQELMAMGFR